MADYPGGELEGMRAAWDRMAADYGERLGLDPADEHYRVLAESVPAAATAVLDLGCGLGYELDALLVRCPDARVTAVDISPEMVRILAGRLADHAGRIETMCASYVDLELGAARYDAAISCLTVHHLVEDTKLDLYRRIRAALLPGGRYCELDEVASAANEVLGQRLYEEHVAARDGGDRGEWNHNMPKTITTQVAWLERAGFTEVDVPWRDVDATGHGKALFVALR